MQRRETNPRAVRAVLVGSALLVACGFQPHIEPLVIGTVPPQPFQASTSIQGTPPDLDQPFPTTPPPPTGSITSGAAIEFCAGLQFYGDEDVGTCLAPGGQTYYVWSDPSNVLEVSGDHPQLDAFRLAALQRLAAQTTFRSKLFDVTKKLAPFPIELAALASCGIAAVPNPGQLIAIPVCLGDLIAIGFTSVAVTKDADASAKALIDFYLRNLDAGYSSCLMQGGTDAQCR